MFPKKKNLSASIFLLVMVFALSFEGSVAAQSKQVRLSIASGPVGSGYYAFAATLSKIISKYIPNTDVTVEATTASLDNCKLVHTGKADLGLTILDTAYEAVNGAEKFKALGPMPLKAVVLHNPYYMYFVTTQGSGINSVSDLKGRRVATGGPGSGTDITTRRVLESYGINMEKDMKRERLQGPHAIEALKDRKIDAFTWVNPLPTGAILDLAVTPGIKIKFLNNSEYLDKLRQKYGPIYSKGIIAKNAYPNLDSEVQVITIFGLLMCNEKMEPVLVYNILKVLFDHQAEIAEFHKDSSYFVLPDAVASSPVPFHPGAIKYYRERGIKVD